MVGRGRIHVPKGIHPHSPPGTKQSTSDSGAGHSQNPVARGWPPSSSTASALVTGSAVSEIGFVQALDIPATTCLGLLPVSGQWGPTM